MGREATGLSHKARVGTPSVKDAMLLLLRLVIAVVSMVVAYGLGTMVMGDTSVPLTPQEAGQAGTALVTVATASALVLSFLVLRSTLRGVRLMGALMLVHFGVETFMTQIETLYFNNAVQMGSEMLLGIIAAGAVRALVFAPVAVILFGKVKPLGQPPVPGRPRAACRLWPCLLALGTLYAMIYFGFGYFVAWQWEDVRLYYSGTAAMKPFLAHFRDLFLSDNPSIVPFQLLRGVLWTGLALLVVRMARLKRWKAALTVGSAFVVLVALPLRLFPNPYMPPTVRQAHFCEILFSMLFYGGVAGWILHGPAEADCSTGPVAGASDTSVRDV